MPVMALSWISTVELHDFTHVNKPVIPEWMKEESPITATEKFEKPRPHNIIP
jgi:hypothetical protein